jgi:Zn-dependent protease/predicted transcriptional regulator
MLSSFRVGSIAGIPIKLDITLLLILPVVAYLIASGMGEIAVALNQVFGAGLGVDTLTVGALPWILGFAAGIGLFVCVLLHELGHAAVAQYYGYGIESITLWLLGGIARPEEQPDRWDHEFWIAIGGPVVSIAIGVGCFLGFGAIGSDPIRFVVGYLAILNIVLAGFNLLPAFPLDGGRVLRALLGRTRTRAEATQIAARIGKLFAVVFGLFGLLAFNLFLVAVAFFVYMAAAAESRQTILEAAFEGVVVGDVMTPVDDVRILQPNETLDSVLERMFSERHTGYPVVDDGQLVGIVTLNDIRSIDPEARPRTTVAETMSTDLQTVDTETEAVEAMQQLARDDIGRLLVTDEAGRLVGLITRSDLVTAMDIIREQRAAGAETSY